MPTVILRVWLVALFIAGCSSTETLPQSQVAALGKDSILILSAPSIDTVRKSRLQLLDVEYGEEVHQLLVQTQVSLNAVVMVAMLPQGVPVFEIQYDPTAGIAVDAYLPLKGIPPEAILADFQLVYWSADNLNKHLRQARVHIVNGGRERRIVSNGQTLITIGYADDYVKLTNHERGYTLTISNVE